GEVVDRLVGVRDRLGQLLHLVGDRAEHRRAGRARRLDPGVDRQHAGGGVEPLDLARRLGDRADLLGDRGDLGGVLGDRGAYARRVLADVIGLTADRAREVRVLVTDGAGEHLAQPGDVAVRDLDHAL